MLQHLQEATTCNSCVYACAGRGANRRAGFLPGSRSRALCILPRSTLLPERSLCSSKLCVEAVQELPGAAAQHAFGLASAHGPPV